MENRSTSELDRDLSLTSTRACTRIANRFTATLAKRSARLVFQSTALAVVIGLAAVGRPVALGANEHPISIIETDAYVTRTKVNLRLSLYAEDLYLFQGMAPNEFDMIPPEEFDRAIDAHRQFLLDRVIVRDAAGEPISGRIVAVEAFDVPLEGVSVGRLMEYSLIYQLEYDLVEPPEFLTFDQEIVDENFLFPSEMKLYLKQSGSESAYSTTLRPNSPYTVRFDWDSPPLSPEADQEAWEEWFTEQREETLGITSYGSIYSFVYITRREVRHEILIPLGTLRTLFDIESADPNFLETDEQDALIPKIEEFLGSVNPVSIDGIEVTPIFDRVDFYGLNLRDFAVQAERRRISMASGRVGVIMTYANKSAPQEVNLMWDLFGPNIASVQTAVFAYEDIEKVEFSRFQDEIENTYSWTDEIGRQLPSLQLVDAEIPQPATRRVPFLSVMSLLITIPIVFVLIRKRMPPGVPIVIVGSQLLFAGAMWQIGSIEIDDPFADPPALEESYQQSVFERLHVGTYRAFDYREESDIYDALATSVDGDLLRELYLGIREQLVVQSQGGAIAIVDEIAIIDGRPVSTEETGAEYPGYEYLCTWTVKGRVEHWGHIHERVYEYTGRFTVEPSDDSWKITRMDLMDEKQISVRQDLRKF